LVYSFNFIDFSFACIGLDYYTTNNNTFNDIIINNLTKWCNITYACFFNQNYILKKTNILFLKKSHLVCTSLILISSNIIKIRPYNMITTKVIINEKNIYACLNKLVLFKLHLQLKKSKCLKHTNKRHNMIFIKKCSPFTNPSWLFYKSTF